MHSPLPLEGGGASFGDRGWGGGDRRVCWDSARVGVGGGGQGCLGLVHMLAVILFRRLILTKNQCTLGPGRSHTHNVHLLVSKPVSSRLDEETK